jgi:hypothetical protein
MAAAAGIADCRARYRGVLLVARRCRSGRDVGKGPSPDRALNREIRAAHAAARELAYRSHADEARAASGAANAIPGENFMEPFPHFD